MNEKNDIINSQYEDYKKSFVHKGYHIVNCNLSTCGRFTYSKAEAMKEYKLTEVQYNFYNSQKENIT